MQRHDYLKETPSQTAGPYVHIGLAPGAAGFDIYEQELGWDIAGPNAAGERIRVEGRVIDGTGNPVKDVLLEAWQADAHGKYAHPEGGGDVEDGFRGWGRVITDFDTGEWGFDTIKPGPVSARAPLASMRPASEEEQKDAFGRSHQGCGPWHHISTCGSSRAESISGSTHACISAMRPRPMPPIRLSI